MTLKVALLCDSKPALAPWIERLADGILRTPGLGLCGLIAPDADIAAPRANPLVRAWLKLEGRAAAKPVPAGSTRYKDTLVCIPRVEAANTEALSAMAPDVIVDLTGVPASLSEEIAPRFGIWSLDFLKQPEAAGAMYAITSGEPVTSIALLHAERSAAPLKLISKAALNTKFIAARNHLFMCEKSVTLILRELKRAALGKLDLEALAPAPEPQRAPGVASLAVYVAGAARETATRVLEKAGTKLGLRPGMFFLKTSESDFSGAEPRTMIAHKALANEYYADPFLWEHEGETWCFFEVYDYATGRGHLSAGRLENGALTDVTVVLKTDYHLSFPFLYEHEGTLFMMPETCSANRIETWRCERFPDQWVREATVLDNVIAADSSLAQIGDDWWLFTNISTDPFGEMNSELHLYKADSPAMKDLTPHPLNPVIFDSRTARNGGRIIEKDGTCYRVSQDNSHGRYGYGVNVMKIDHISLDDYRETIVRKIEPDFEPGAIGCHHMDSRGKMVVMDVRTRIGGRPRQRGAHG